MRLTRHEQANRYCNKLRALGLQNRVIFKLLPDDRVKLIRVNDTKSQGRFVIPSFVTDIQHGYSLDGNIIVDINFEDCQFTEIYFDNEEGFELDLSYMCSDMKSKQLKVWLAHPECVINSRGMFHNCENLEFIDLSQINIANCLEASSMFRGCKNLKSIDTLGLNAKNINSIAGMFFGCESLESIDLSGIHTSEVMSLEMLFKDCKSLIGIDLRKLDLHNVRDISNICFGCESLRYIKFPDEGLSSLRYSINAFKDCQSFLDIQPKELITRLRV